MKPQLAILSVTDLKRYRQALQVEEADVIMLSDCHIGNLQSLTKECHNHGKKVAVNLDLIGGFTADQVGIKILKNLYKIDIALSNSPTKINWANKAGLTTIHLMMLYDSKTLMTAQKMLTNSKADYFEFRPSYYALEEKDSLFSIKPDGKFIIGGFIKNKEIFRRAIELGFYGIESSSHSIWKD